MLILPLWQQIHHVAQSAEPRVVFCEWLWLCACPLPGTPGSPPTIVKGLVRLRIKRLKGLHLIIWKWVCAAVRTIRPCTLHVGLEQGCFFPFLVISKCRCQSILVLHGCFFLLDFSFNFSHSYLFFEVISEQSLFFTSCHFFLLFLFSPFAWREWEEQTDTCLFWGLYFHTFFCHLPTPHGVAFKGFKNLYVNSLLLHSWPQLYYFSSLLSLSLEMESVFPVVPSFVTVVFHCRNVVTV